jgi:hypothetical protein
MQDLSTFRECLAAYAPLQEKPANQTNLSRFRKSLRNVLRAFSYLLYGHSRVGWESLQSQTVALVATLPIANGRFSRDPSNRKRHLWERQSCPSDNALRRADTSARDCRPTYPNPLHRLGKRSSRRGSRRSDKPLRGGFSSAGTHRAISAVSRPADKLPFRHDLCSCRGLRPAAFSTRTEDFSFPLA